jgi:hypothetical protein
MVFDAVVVMSQCGTVKSKNAYLFQQHAVAANMIKCSMVPRGHNPMADGTCVREVEELLMHTNVL